MLIQNGMIFAWIVLNTIALFAHWDPWPFLFLNIIMSWQAANSSPILQMSQNRQAQKDRLRDDHEAEEVDLLYRINQQQLEILALLRTAVCPPDATDADTTAAPAPLRPVTASERRASVPVPRRRRR